MNELTPQQKVTALIQMNPKLTWAEACKLLGFDPNQVKPEMPDMPDILKDMFGGFDEKRNT